MRDAVPAFALATGIVVALTTVLAWMVDHWLLAPFGLEYLRTLSLLLIAGTLAQLAVIAMKRPSDMTAALALTGFAVLAVVFLETRPTLAGATVQGLGAGIGLGIAIVLFAAMRERLAAADVPAPFRGAPIALLTAALMALGLLGLSGLGAG